MKRRLLLAAVILINTVIFGCGPIFFIETENSNSCDVPSQNEYLYRLMKHSYLWNDQVPDVDYLASPSPEELMKELIYTPVDKWSTIISAETFHSRFIRGEYTGYGFMYEIQTEALLIKLVYKLSPAEMAGLLRGEKITAINGESLLDIVSQDKLSDVLSHGDAASFEIMGKDGSLRTIVMNKGTVNASGVQLGKVIQLPSGKKAGYLLFQNFTEAAYDDLLNAFALFESEQIEELAVDLRYNGGGTVSSANYLAGLIAGSTAQGKRFVQLSYNDLNKNLDNEYLLPDTGINLSLSRVFVITTSNTCSSSEALVKGLSPHMNVVQIGSSTCGKPVGFRAYSYCEKVFLPVSFRFVNADGEKDWFDGIQPLCGADDDLANELGDSNEGMLAATFDYVEAGTCVTPKISKGRRIVDFFKNNG
ncbi:MAG: S41 family peptidase [Nitrospinota bacterium]